MTCTHTYDGCDGGEEVTEEGAGGAGVAILFGLGLEKMVLEQRFGGGAAPRGCGLSGEEHFREDTATVSVLLRVLLGVQGDREEA